MIAFLPFPTEKFKFAVFLAGIDTVQSMGNKSTLVEDVIEIETTNLQNRLLQFEDDEAYDSTRETLHNSP